MAFLPVSQTGVLSSVSKKNSYTPILVQLSLGAGFDKVCTQVEEKPAVHLPSSEGYLILPSSVTEYKVCTQF